MNNHEGRPSLASSVRGQNGTIGMSAGTGSNSDVETLKKKTRKRRTILQKEYDEFSLKRMGIDGSSSKVRDNDEPGGEGRCGEVDHEGWDVDGYAMATFGSQLVASLSGPPDPPLSSSEITDRASKEQIESWKDFEYPDYEDRFDFEAVNRLSEYRCQEEKSIWHSRRWRCCNTICQFCYRNLHVNNCESTAIRRSTSIIFVISVVVISAAMIGYAIPRSQKDNINSKTMIHTTTFHDAVENGEMKQHFIPPPSSKYTPIRSNNQQQSGNSNSMDEYTPQQLLELAEDIIKSCDPQTITTSEERKMCQTLCIDRMCCFDPGKYGCAQDEEMMCTVYVGCQVLYGYDSEMMISNLENNGIERQPGIEYNGGNIANHYHQSSILADETASVSNTANSLQLADDIIQYCDEYLKDPYSSSGRKCIAFCREHMCCFEDVEIGSGCIEEEGNKFSCQVYEGCEVLVGVDELEAKM
eukprot:CCRYP_015936-RA/>CCRYP_015936-RA protein AED:0.12 eAED:0.12 QI:184/1/1/1/0.25/0.2/5/1410/469